MSNSDWTPEREVQRRIDSLSKGPWTGHSNNAIKFLKPVSPVDRFLEGDWNVSMASLQPLLVEKDVNREAEFARVFRPHWLEQDGITDEDEIDIRDSLDEALTHLQLMELAVEMGYVPLEAIREPARRQLAALLWSPATRKFVFDYDYLSVGYLATRVGVDIGQGELEPPAIHDDGAIRFALVLAEHVRWSRDDVIDEWLHFLDDYVVIEHEQSLFEDYLLSGRKSPTKLSARQQDRFNRLADGAAQFVLSLSTLMAPLNAHERPCVGLLYSYWLAKFFGYERGTKGYRKVDDGWVEAVATGVVPETEDAKDHEAYRAVIRSRIETLSETWNAVRILVGEPRSKGQVQKRASEPMWLQCVNLPESEFLGSSLSRAAPSWQRQQATKKGNLVTVTVPHSHADVLAEYLAELPGSDDATVLIVLANGKVKRKIIKTVATSEMPRSRFVLDQIVGAKI